MENVRFPLLVYLALCLVISVLSQDQSGFISIDCGIPSGSSYTDDTTGINYVSDSSFVETGVSKPVSFPAQRQLQNLMSFPEGKGTPFISTLELRFLGNDNTTYDSPNGALFFSRRWNFGSLSDSSIRYSEDVYDRIWLPRKLGAENKEINTSLPVTSSNNSYNPPGLLMSTALTPTNTTAPISMELADTDPTVRYFVYMHFAEVEDLSLTPNQTREFEIYINQVKIAHVSPRYLQTDTFFLKPESQTNIKFLLIYVGNTYSQSFTSQDDDDAVTSIKMSYKVKRNWQGDPCLPNSYIWEGLNCSYASLAPPRITLLNLSSSGLTGHLSPSFSNLTMIQELDLSNNDLTGDIPESLSKLKFLRVLNLEKNKLTGSVPSDLLKRSKSGSLLLKVGDNPGLCTEISCVKSNKKTLITAVGASLAALFILLLLSGVFWKIKKRNTDSETRNRPKADSNTLLLTFSDIVKMTNNFCRVLGKGGFGTVYHGYYNDLQVAVKLLSESSAQGFKEFRSEVIRMSMFLVINFIVEVLVRVHHVNLTALIGYFHESNKMGLVYEFMANGNMADRLSGKCDHTLSWTQRLQIAHDAAQGLEYLHSGCKPAIVHRDVKTSNILLNENNRAKLADFGLSRSFQTESRSHVSTLVAGTPGYLDPLCFKTNELNEKSDIYSFGVVLLEMITGKAVISESETKRVHVSDWVISILKSTNDVSNVVDAKMRGDFDANSVWKIVELALASVSQNVVERPNMQQIVRGVKECQKHYRLFSNEAQPNFNLLQKLKPNINPLHMSHRGMEFSREAGMMMENKRSVCSLEESSIKRHKSDLSFSSKQRKDKAGERISALQQIVSPYGKTDIASVLLDAMHYIEFLHEQVKVLSAPYLQTVSTATLVSMHLNLEHIILLFTMS
ncbi:BnaA08g28390D [Brassica napus]|uniref:non-specific serine/threonine protein kinase n=1 Tax=Brassica napus TaxID=3708 RepID=A0A078FMC0_BRANA|nr:BnaA08g28390D [Brassica napus]